VRDRGGDVGDSKAGDSKRVDKVGAIDIFFALTLCPSPDRRGGLSD